MTSEASSRPIGSARIERLMTLHPALAVTKYDVLEREGRLIVEVEGREPEARMWRTAIDGRIYPSHTDVRGVRRQLVYGLGIEVQVVNVPAGFDRLAG